MIDFYFFVVSSLSRRFSMFVFSSGQKKKIKHKQQLVLQLVRVPPVRPSYPYNRFVVIDLIREVL